MTTTTIDITALTSLDVCLEALAEAIPPIVSRDPRCYPFVGEKQVRARLENDPGLRTLVAVTMFWLQTDVEQAKRETIEKNRRGLMSSHAAVASKLISSLIAGATPDEALEYRCDGFKFQGHEALLAHLGSRYAKQTSVCLRTWAMAQDPALAVTASMFSVR
jgi:hypothetical protein